MLGWKRMMHDGMNKKQNDKNLKKKKNSKNNKIINLKSKLIYSILREGNI